MFSAVVKYRVFLTNSALNPHRSSHLPFPSAAIGERTMLYLCLRMNLKETVKREMQNMGEIK